MAVIAPVLPLFGRVMTFLHEPLTDVRAKLVQNWSNVQV